MTDYTFTRVTPHKKLNQGALNTAFATFDIDTETTAGLAKDDTIYGIVVPSGCTIVDYYLNTDEVDTSGSNTGKFDVGIEGGDVDALLDGVAVGGSASNYVYTKADAPAPGALVSSGSTINQPSNGPGYTTTAESTFGILVSDTVATAATSGQIVLGITWSDNVY